MSHFISSLNLNPITVFPNPSPWSQMSPRKLWSGPQAHHQITKLLNLVDANNNAFINATYFNFEYLAQGNFLELPFL